MKHTARKVRRLFQGQVLAGFAGSVADAFTLFELFETESLKILTEIFSVRPLSLLNNQMTKYCEVRSNACYEQNNLLLVSGTEKGKLLNRTTAF